MLKPMIIAALLLVSCSTLYAQNTLPNTLQTDVLSAQQGLTSRQITCVLQDKYGFLWFGSQNGLFRWDGIAMTAFTQQSGDTTALPSSTILHLHQDKRGVLWIGTASGLARFHRHNDSFSTFLAEQPISDLHEDSRGALWCWIHTATAQADKIALFDPQSGAESRFQEGEKGIRSAYLYSFLEDKFGTVWLGTSNGIHRFEREKQVFTAFLTDAISPQSPAKSQESHIYALAQDAQGTLLVGTGKGLLQCKDRINARFEPFISANSTMLLRESGILLLQKNEAGNIYAATMQRGTSADAGNRLVWIDLARGTMSVPVSVIPLEGKAQSHRTALDANGNLWWGVGNGAVKLNTNTMQTELLLADPNAPNRINAPVAGISAASSGAIWFARTSSGVSMMLPPLQPFHALHFAQPASTNSQTLLSQTLLSQNVSALGESPDGAVWIGYMGGAGLSRLNRTTQTLTHFRQDPKNPASIGGYDGETNIYAFYGDKRGAWWIGSYVLERQVPQGFAHTVLLPNETVPATAMVEDSYGNFWVGSPFGLFLLDKLSAVQKRFVNKASNDASLGNNNIHALLEDRAKTLWIAHDGGVDRLDPVNKRFQRFRAVQGDGANSTVNAALSLTSGAATALLEDAKGRIWIGTRGGLTLFDPTSRTVTRRITKREGLPDNAVAGLCNDDTGNIWISTRRGLCRYSPESAVTTTFSRADGIADDEFLEGAALRTKDGKLWFGARSAVVYFYPDSIHAYSIYAHSIEAHSTGAKAVITGLKKFGEHAFWGEYIADASSIELGYSDKVIALEFAAPGALYPEKVHYAYQLDGLDTAWVQADGQHEAKYTNLPDGMYSFQVKAADANGVWQREPTTLTVVVRPAWWRTWWFLGGAALVLGASGLFAYKQRIRAIEARNQELKHLVDERTHQLKAANIEVHRQLEILNEQAKDIEIANARLQENNIELSRTATELKETQTQLVQSERINAAGMLTAGVMHEINNPNASIHSALELAEQKIASANQYFLSMLDVESRTSEEAKHFVGMVQQIQDIISIALKGSERIRGIVTALQGFTKHQHEGLSRNKVLDEIHSTAEMFKYQFKDVAIEEDVPSSLYLKVQWAEINQSMLNLLVNAAQAGATRICISAEKNELSSTMQFRISDNGSGMNRETQERIFEPFYTTKSVGNSGLGLSITRQIIERHAGSVSVESELGKGTTFVITLPEQISDDAIKNSQ
jgi:signal transduction histidine kinase/ligand-binding sensor domain-containing protein